MKVAPVDRYGSWRPGGTDARAVSSSRLQTVTPETTPQAAPPALSSGRELPVVAVKRGTDVQARTVKQSDRPVGLDPALNTFAEFQGKAPAAGVSAKTTVETFAGGKSAVGGAVTGTANAALGASTGTTLTGAQKQEAESAASKLSAPKREDLVAAQRLNKQPKSDAQMTAAEKAASLAKEQAAEEAKKPPREPIAKMLMDQVQAVWAASRSVVDAANPAPKAGAAATNVSSKTSSTAVAAAAAQATSTDATSPAAASASSSQGQASSRS